jgi:hypothetical protein
MFTSSSATNEEGDPTGCLCPNLEVLDISSSNTFSETTLLQFIKAKNGDINNNNNGIGEPSPPSIPGLAKLKTVFVTFHHRQINDINPQLEQYRQAGLEVSITYPTVHLNLFSPFDGLPNNTSANGGATWLAP